MNEDAPVVLQSWEACVESVDDGSLELELIDTTVDRGDLREIGTFPASMFEHLVPPSQPGRILTVEVMSDRTIRIADVVITDAKREEGRRNAAELLRLLDELRID
jgi:hypothetical protein